MKDNELISSMAAIRIDNGAVLWSKRLSAPVVKGGVAIDRESRIVVVLENGKVVCVQ
jgi:hypothetical protein